jgi:hypothetical protein
MIRRILASSRAMPVRRFDLFPQGKNKFVPFGEGIEIMRLGLIGVVGIAAALSSIPHFSVVNARIL